MIVQSEQRRQDLDIKYTRLRVHSPSRTPALAAGDPALAHGSREMFPQGGHRKNIIADLVLNHQNILKPYNIYLSFLNGNSSIQYFCLSNYFVYLF